MRMISGMILSAAFLIAASAALAQRPGGGPGAPRKSTAADLVARMMAFDADKDGKLTKDEVTDERLHRLFDRADADKDGIVTKNELTALATKEAPKARGGRPGFGSPGGGPPGFGPPGGGPPGFGPPDGGPAGFMMRPPRPGEVLPAMLQQRLGLTAEQKKQVDALQKEVDAKLENILNDEQKAQLKQMRERGPGGFGPPGGPGGPGGPGAGGSPLPYEPPSGEPPETEG
jgi:hypothetical protein